MCSNRSSLWLVGFLVVFSAAAGQVWAFDPISVGLRAGVPLTDVLPDENGDQPFTTDMKRFTIGPALELGLPLGLGIEFDALYKRFDQIVPGEPAAEGSSWEFVLVGKYRAGFPLVRPYVEAGVSFNRLSDFVTAVRRLDAETRSGIVAGAGLELSLPAVRIIPGIRYSHFGEELSLPSTNLVDFHVGILF